MLLEAVYIIGILIFIAVFSIAAGYKQNWEIALGGATLSLGWPVFVPAVLLFKLGDMIRELRVHKSR